MKKTFILLFDFPIFDITNYWVIIIISALFEPKARPWMRLLYIITFIDRSIRAVLHSIDYFFHQKHHGRDTWNTSTRDSLLSYRRRHASSLYIKSRDHFFSNCSIIVIYIVLITIIIIRNWLLLCYFFFFRIIRSIRSIIISPLSLDRYVRSIVWLFLFLRILDHYWTIK